MIRLVCGPPGSGKTTFVGDRRSDGDLVVDLDAIRASGVDESTARRLRSIMEGSASTHDEGDVWIVRTLADPTERAEFVQRVGVGEVTVLATDRDTAVARVRARDGSDEKVEAIDKWFSRFKANEGDQVLTGKEEDMDPDEQQQGEQQQGEQRENQHGFPSDTPVAEMTLDEQVAYWKFHSRKHERNASEAAQKLARDSEDAQKWRELEDKNKPADQKEVEAAVAEARSETEAKVRDEFFSKLFQAELRSACKDFPGLDADALAEVLNVSSFRTEDGGVDTDKINTTLNALPSGVKNEDHPGIGSDTPFTGGSSIDVGRELYASFKN